MARKCSGLLRQAALVKQNMGTGAVRAALRTPGCQMLLLAIACAMLFAPVVVAVTHGPVTAEQIHVHHSTGHDHHSEPTGSHDPADHDHQLQALISPTAGWVHVLPNTEQSTVGDTFRHLMPEGPRRPPRLV